MLKKLTTISLLGLSILTHAETTIIKNSEASLNENDIKAIYQSLSSVKYEEIKQTPSLFLSVVEKTFNNIQLAKALAPEVTNSEYYKQMKAFNDDAFIVNSYIQAQIKQKLDKINLKKLAKQEYLANQKEYTSPSTVDLYHILFLKDSNMSEKSPEETINSIHESITSGEMSIEEAAKKYRISITGTDEAGMLKGLSYKELPKSFQDELTKLNKGQVSEVFSDNLGHHIIAINAFDICIASFYSF